MSIISLEELFKIFGKFPKPVIFDESLYEVDLSLIISSI